MELPALTAPLPIALRALAFLAIAVGLTLPAPATAEAQSTTRTTLLQAPPADRPPEGMETSSRTVIRKALAVPKIRELRRENPRSYVRAFTVEAPDAPRRGWQVSVFDPRPGPDEEIAQVILDDAADGEVLESYTGFQVEWTMARGYPGAFGRKANALYVWIPLLLLFLAPFLRPPWRLLHVDLLVLCAFSISYAVFGTGRIGWSVPLVYPCLAYLLVRMLMIARARGRPGAGSSGAPPFHVKRWSLVTPPAFLTMAIIFLVGFRLGLNYSASNVIDVGYSGVIGADLIAGGDTLYGGFPDDNPRGDTYGPANYLAYVPFEQIAPWSGTWDDLPAAHAASVAFDLLTAVLLWLVGRRLKPAGAYDLGLLLPYLWLAFPFTLLVSNSNANDSLVAVLVLIVFLLAGRPVARGAATAAAGLTKFAPLLLAPLMATFPVERGARRGAASRKAALRSTALTVAGVLVGAAIIMLPVWVGEGGLSTFYERTLGFQADRSSPFSIWGYVEGDLEWLQRALEVGVVVLALVVAFIPRRRDLISLAALAAAVLIASQVVVTHWFYLYIVWFLPLVLIALLADDDRHGPPSAA